MDECYYSSKYKSGVCCSVYAGLRCSYNQAIQEVTNLTPQIKWPNDILINGKKVTGILTELQADMDIVHSIIIGIGVNVNQELRHLTNPSKHCHFIENGKWGRGRSFLIGSKNTLLS